MEDKIKFLYYGITLLIPLALLAISFYFKNHLPKKHNAIYGYRTGGSARNQDTWNEANQYSSKLFFKLSVIGLNIELLIIAFARYLINFIDSETLLIWALFSPLIIPILIIPFTEIHLGKVFTKEGIRKKKEK